MPTQSASTISARVEHQDDILVFRLTQDSIERQ
jgi:hypothetical protein